MAEKIKVYSINDLPKLMEDPDFYFIKDSTGKIIEAGRITQRVVNLDTANNDSLQRFIGASNFNLGRVPGSTSSTRPGGVREETSI